MVRGGHASPGGMEASAGDQRSGRTSGGAGEHLRTGTGSISCGRSGGVELRGRANLGDDYRDAKGMDWSFGENRRRNRSEAMMVV